MSHGEKTLERIWGKSEMTQGDTLRNDLGKGGRKEYSAETSKRVFKQLHLNFIGKFDMLLTALLSLLNVCVRLVWELTLMMMTDAFLCWCWKHALTPYKVEVRTHFAFVLNSFCVRAVYVLRSYWISFGVVFDCVE